MPFRVFIFWIHLAAGLVAGLIIAIMAFTGSLLAFGPEITAWAERDARRVEVPAGAAPLPLDELLARFREVAPEGTRPSGITVSNDPAAAVVISAGREATYYANPYTGAIKPPAASGTRDFLILIESWHRRLALSGDHRDTGRAITGACNAAFLVLAVTGLYLWWPRKWIWRSIRPSVVPVKARGKYRDWNWHNAAGFWCLPVIIILTATGLAFSYRWAGNLPYRLVGEEPPAQGGPADSPSTDLAITRPEGARRLSYAATLAHIQEAIPTWTSITLREGLPRRRGAPAPAAGQPPEVGNGERQRGEGGRQPQPYSATVRADDGTPSFASLQLVLNPFNGDILSRSGYEDLTTGRKVRTWMRFLHTGQALGWPGQLAAGIACLGSLLLIYSGFALSWRRFFGRRRVSHLPSA